MIRAFLVISEIILFLLLGVPLLLIAYLISLFNRKAAGDMAQVIVQFVIRLILATTLAKVEVRGTHNIPGDQAVFFAGNHRSDFDIVIAYANTPKRFAFVAKAEMEKIPLLAQWMHLLHCVFLDRKDIKKGMQAILKGAEHIKQGTSMWIFPEGSRSKGIASNECDEFKGGSFKMAQKASSLIVPVAIHGSEKIFETQKPRIKTASVIIEYGEPIDMTQLSDEDKKKIGVYTSDKIKAMLDKMPYYDYK